MDSMQRGFRRGPSFRSLPASMADAFSRILGRPKPRSSGFASQRVCPFCGRITPRSLVWSVGTFFKKFQPGDRSANVPQMRRGGIDGPGQHGIHF
jgi:hypothetical protein